MSKLLTKGVTMSVQGFAREKREDIQRIELCEYAYNLGQAAVELAEAQGTSTTITRPSNNEHDTDREVVLTPYIKIEGGLAEGAIGRIAFGSGSRPQYMLDVMIDERNSDAYARIPEQPRQDVSDTRPRPTIQYNRAEDVGLENDRELIKAFEAVAADLGVDIEVPELKASPVILPTTSLTYLGMYHGN